MLSNRHGRGGSPGRVLGARRVLGLVSLFLVAGGGLGFFLSSSAFGLSEIMVVGSAHLTSSDVVRLCEVRLGMNLLKIPTQKIRDRLLADSRLSEAVVSRKLPGRLVVQVTERVGVVLLPCQEQFAEIDASGLPLELHSCVGALGLPIVTGVTEAGVTLGVRVSGDKLAAILGCAAALGDSRRLVAEIHVDEQNELRLYTREGIPVYFGSPTGLEAKVEAFLGVLADVRAEKLDVAYIDVRYPRYPAVGAPGGAEAPSPWVDPDIFPTLGEP
jgi:cell division protein FtsQ